MDTRWWLNDRCRLFECIAVLFVSSFRSAAQLTYSQNNNILLSLQGIELAILGDDSIPPMLPGGIRRVIIPANLGYQSILNEKDPKCIEGKDIGPIPPKNNSDGGYQRWYQFYCNPRIPYQPDIVLDIKLYGKRLWKWGVLCCEKRWVVVVLFYGWGRKEHKIIYAYGHMEVSYKQIICEGESQIRLSRLW